MKHWACRKSRSPGGPLFKRATQRVRRARDIRYIVLHISSRPTSLIGKKKFNFRQYQPVPSSPIFLLVGFSDSSLWPGVLPLAALSKIPPTARLPTLLKLSNPARPESTPLMAVHSGEVYGLLPSPRSAQRVTTMACLNCVTLSVGSSIRRASTRYSVGHSGHRLAGRHSSQPRTMKSGFAADLLRMKPR